MSLRPGARWSPQTQGIAGGIGSAFAGVSDQIRRVMQDRAVFHPGRTTTGSGYKVTTSPTVAFSNYSGRIEAYWSVPGSAVDGFSVMAAGVTISGAGSGDRFEFFNTIGWLNDGGAGGSQMVYPAVAGTNLGAGLVDASSAGGAVASFYVVAW